ncbi:FkbM family methyltransferase [Desulfosarcina ovata]|nr:FkbM family methyltransferase [Desulfosarcina ovata]
MIIKKYIPCPIRNILNRIFDFFTWDQWCTRSWSQEGEDMVLRRIFEKKKNGFYVDVGAHHPKRFSNTYALYQRGWSGINIDAMPGSMRLFRKWRPKDINLELGIGKIAGSFDYYIFNEPALNGFSSQLSEDRARKDNPYYIKDVIEVDIFPLRDVLDKHVDGKSIDFLSVDVEGLDLEVLKSNDWSKYRPRYVLAEMLASSLNDIVTDPVVQFMNECGYVIYAKQVNTVFFRNKDSLY